MPGCSVACCTNHSRKTKGKNIMYHSFPKDAELNKIWINRCRRKDNFNVSNARMCSQHFTAEDYIRDMQAELVGMPSRRILKPDAVPTVNIPGYSVKAPSVSINTNEYESNTLRAAGVGSSNSVSETNTSQRIPVVGSVASNVIDRANRCLVRDVRKRVMETLATTSPKKRTKFGTIDDLIQCTASDYEETKRRKVLEEENQRLNMEDKKWETFFHENPPPADIATIKQQIIAFCHKHAKTDTRVVLVTSGGTTVPLEHNTVRFVDNFSAGTRGAASTEYFLKAGYAVIFVHRAKSLEPFSRHLSGKQILDSLNAVQDSCDCWKIEVKKDCVPTLLPVLQQYRAIRDSGRLLDLSFTTLSEYLHLLFVAAEAVKPLKKKSMLYLAAAVSDFYIPPPDMATHKISSDEPLLLNLQLVPKALRPLVCRWAPDAFVVSFKLETNDDVLLEKARGALDKYGHKLVIANQLHTRKKKVTLVTKETAKTILLSDEEMKMGKEIEEKIVDELLIHHSQFMVS